MKRIHIFRAGTHRSTSGHEFAFSEAALAATAAAYNPALHEAPLVVGHPQLDGPAYGWTKTLAATPSGLVAEPHQVQPAFAELVQANAYKKVSAKFYGPDDPGNPVPGVFYLRHIGFLGAHPPAIKGLKPIEFAADAGGLEFEIEFSEADTTATDPAPAAPAAPATDPATPPANPPTTEQQTFQDLFPIFRQLPTSPTGEPPAMTPAEIKALQDELAASKAQLASAQTAMQAQAQAANTARHTAFAEALVAEARIAPADKALLVATLNHMEPATLPGATAQLVQFGEGTAAKPMAEALRDFLKGLPKRVEFGEQASRDRAAPEGTADGVTYAEGTAPESIDLDKRIRAHAAAHKLSYAEAATAVSLQRG